MRSSTWARIAQAMVVVVLTAATVGPAAAQLGGLKKKVKAATGASAAADKGTPAPTGAEGGGTLVLSDDVLDRLIEGLRAGKGYREAATKENTPYGQYLQASAAYSAAKTKCDAATQTYGQRVAADQKLAVKSNAFLEKMMAAQQKQDTTMQRVWADSLLWLQDPACTVKQPRQPDNWFDLQREVDNGAEQQELKASGFDRQELGAVRDRAEAILKDASPPDVSPSEKDAVKKRADQLKRLMGLEQAPAARAEKPVPPAAAPPPQPVTPTVSPDQAAMSDCMAKNAKKHENEFQRLAERAKAVSEGGDMQATMAIADSIRQLQMAGCSGN